MEKVSNLAPVIRDTPFRKVIEITSSTKRFHLVLAGLCNLNSCYKLENQAKRIEGYGLLNLLCRLSSSWSFEHFPINLIC